MRLSELCSYVGQMKHRCPLVSLHRPVLSSSNCVYPRIEFIGHPKLRQHYHQLKGVKWRQYDFARDFAYDCVIYPRKDDSKANITEWLHSIVLNPAILGEKNYKKIKLESVFARANLNEFILLRVKSLNQLIATKYLMICGKKESVRHDSDEQKNETLRDKLDIQLFVRGLDFDKMNMIEKLAEFSFCCQLVRFAESLQCVELISDTCCGYFYDVVYENEGIHEHQVDNYRLTPDCDPICVNIKSKIVSAAIQYDPICRPIPTIDSFNKTMGIPRSFGPMIIADKIFQNVIPHKLALQFWHNHWKYIHSGDGFHEFRPLKQWQKYKTFDRCKTYWYYYYIYNNDYYKNKKKIFDKTNEEQRKLAARNVGAGLRWIGDEHPCPEYVKSFIHFLKLIRVIEPNKHYDQIGVNVYKRPSTAKKSKSFTYSGISSHFECDKFTALDQCNLGSASVLSFDVHGECVDALAGVELPENSFVRYPMESYWFSAQKVQKSGGKHTVIKRNLAFKFGEYRMVLLLRECVESAMAEAMRHYKNCQNNDEKCSCIN